MPRKIIHCCSHQHLKNTLQTLINAYLTSYHPPFPDEETECLEPTKQFAAAFQLGSVECGAQQGMLPFNLGVILLPAEVAADTTSS